MKRLLLTVTIFLVGISLVQAQGTSQLLKWNDGPDKPVISIQGTDKIGKCSNGTLQTGHTESKAIVDYRWVWDECPKVKVLDFNNMKPGTYVCKEKGPCVEQPKETWIVPHLSNVIQDGDTVTISGEMWSLTGKIKIESPK